MKLNRVFQTAEVPIPDRSGFDLSREHLLTADTGTLVPAECLEVLPNDTISMGSMMKVTLPPFAAPFMGRIDACLEAFFVPSRILWKGWQSFITQNAGYQTSASLPNGSVPLQVPVIDTQDSDNLNYLSHGTLADYLGYMNNSPSASIQNQPYISAMKFLAYHMVCDYWYRDQNNVKPFFAKNTPLNQSAINAISPHFINNIMPYSPSPVLKLLPQAVGGGNVYDNLVDVSIGLGSLRQRCWAKDYFTTMTTRPQAGDAAQITFATNASTGSITIADIRAASALQKWLERNNLSGTDYGSQILAHFGVTPPDAIMDKPILLGAVREPVYVGSVENNTAASVPAGSDGGNEYDGRNPYSNALGSAAGFGSSFGKGTLVPEFHAKEHGYILVMYSLVPHAYYESGVERELFHTRVGDFGWPEYAHIGDQEVYDQELYASDSHPGDIIGYNQRYSEYKFRLDKISGLLHDNKSLDVYALKRTFASDPQLGKAFLEIPTDFLDQVYAVESWSSNFSCMADIYFDTKGIRLLPEYSLPKI